MRLLLSKFQQKSLIYWHSTVDEFRVIKSKSMANQSEGFASNVKVRWDVVICVISIRQQMVNMFCMVGSSQEKWERQRVRFEFPSMKFAKSMPKSVTFSWLEMKKVEKDLDSKKVEIKDNLLQLRNSRIIRFELTVRTRARKCASEGMIIFTDYATTFTTFSEKDFTSSLRNTKGLLRWHL